MLEVTLPDGEKKLYHRPDFSKPASMQQRRIYFLDDAEKRRFFREFGDAMKSISHTTPKKVGNSIYETMVM